jgi:hypothetical protein
MKAVHGTRNADRIYTGQLNRPCRILISEITLNPIQIESENIMSTRGLYSFIDSENTRLNVFKHWDNYPEGAYPFIQKALALAWDLPRFEADEFGAAFIAANKKGGGDLRLLNEASTNGDILGIEYHYFITSEGEQLKITTKDLYNDTLLPIVYITNESIQIAHDETYDRYLALKQKADSITNDNGFKNWADFAEYSELLDIFDGI